MNTTVFLIGYMGCGKTTLGASLAAIMDVPFIDLDEHIEKRCHATICEITAQMGITRFRKIERKALVEVAKDDMGAVVSCGGGTPLYPGNMELINRTGLSVWLTTSPERIASRLMLPQEKVKRPLIANLPDEQILDFVKQGLHEREPFYSQAQLRFDSTYLESPQEIASTAHQLAAMLKSANP